jgi:hypothetical protein
MTGSFRQLDNLLLDNVTSLIGLLHAIARHLVSILGFR